MYESAFPEDSQRFVDYYYEWKTKDNEVIAMEGAGEDSSFHVVVHLNPYTLAINGNSREIPYIVAVATDPRFRRQGKMAQVMGQALRDMELRGVPFTFLLPADPAYYRGQGFVFFPCQEYLDTGGVCIAQEQERQELQAASLDSAAWKEARLEALEPAGWEEMCPEALEPSRWEKARQEEAAEMAGFANHVLEQRCGIFIRRDAGYYRRLSAELEAEHGGVMLQRAQGSVSGVLLYSLSGTHGHTAEVRELLLADDVPKEEAVQICRDALRGAGVAADAVRFTSSRMMVRLTSLEALVPLLYSSHPVLLEAEVSDPVIAANNGRFRIEIDCDGGRVLRTGYVGGFQKMDIAELTRKLFAGTSVYLNEWV